MKKRFHWGHGVALVLAGYVGLMVYMGMRAMAIDTDLVREDYYQAELGHDEQMASEALGRAYGTPRVHLEGGKLVVEGRPEDLDAQLAGGAHLYVPMDSRSDRTWEWPALAGQRTAPGRYEVAMDFPRGLGYLTFTWPTAHGRASARVPVHFPS